MFTKAERAEHKQPKKEMKDLIYVCDTCTFKLPSSMFKSFRRHSVNTVLYHLPVQVSYRLQSWHLPKIDQCINAEQI